MPRVNWNKAAAAATKLATSRGHEANITQVKNVLNDLSDYLVDEHSPGEIIDAVLSLSERQHR